MEFNNPGSHSDKRGLVDHGTSVQLPFQVMKDFGGFEFNADFGGVWHHGGEHEWFGGVAVGRELRHGVEVSAELHGDADAHLNHITVIANLGLRVALTGTCSLLTSFGRELHNDDEPRAGFIGYLGLQIQSPASTRNTSTQN